MGVSYPRGQLICVCVCVSLYPPSPIPLTNPHEFVKIGPTNVDRSTSSGISSPWLPRISLHPHQFRQKKILKKYPKKIARIWIYEFVEFFVVFVHGSVVLGVDLTPHKFPATDLPNSPRNRGFLGRISTQIAKNSRQRYYRSTSKRYYRPK